MKHLFKEYVILIKSFFANISQFIKYQIITKAILSLIVIPTYSMISGYLIYANGNNALTNGDIVKFFITPQGFCFLFLIAITAIAELILEIGGYIAISCKIEANQQESKYVDLVKYNIKLLPKMFSVGGIVIIIYLLILAPLSGFGLKLNFLKGFNVPNFVMSVIEKNDTYKMIYGIIIFLIIISSVLMIFTFHYMILHGKNSIQAIKSSVNLIKNNKKTFLIDVLGITFINIIVVALILIVWGLLLLLFNRYSNGLFGRTLSILLLQIQGISMLLISALVVPFECLHFTKIFYSLNPEDQKIYINIKSKEKESVLDKLFKKKKTLIFIALLVLLPLSLFVGLFTKEFLGYNDQILIMAHRGYGEGVPENSISSIKKSISEKVDFIEIDVQRTKDRVYILNHDKNFSRVSNKVTDYINEEITDLTYEQIKAFDIGKGFGDKYKNEKVPTIDEVLDLCNEKIGINLELKGNVDEKMIDDLMKMVEKKGMKDQVIFTSLNRSNIEYLEAKDSSFNTGLIYFITIGDFSSINADYLILEEREATDKNIEKIHKNGKYVIVWTVNTDESIDKITEMDIDGIITDYPQKVKKHIKSNSKLSDKELIFFRFLETLNISH